MIIPFFFYFAEQNLQSAPVNMWIFSFVYMGENKNGK